MGRTHICKPLVRKYAVGCRLLFETAPGIDENLDFLSIGKSYANSHFISKICDP